MKLFRRQVLRSYCTVCTCILIAGLLSACAPSAPRVIPTFASIEFTPAVDPGRQSSGGGEPRTPGYWLIWNTCAENNQSETARANGGREAGWILLDDLLVSPGILLGELQLETCTQGLNLLQTRDISGTDHGADPAYILTAQLLTAQLNLATGTETCPAADEAVQAAQLLLLSLGFNGTGIYLGPPVASQDRDTALILTDQLSQYNAGTLCIP